MHGFLRVCGGIGLVIGILVIAACLYVAVRVDGAVCRLTDQADQAIASVQTRLTDADERLKTLNHVIVNAAHNQAEELDPKGLEAVGKLRQAVQEVQQHLDQVAVALQKTIAMVDLLHSIGLNIDGHQIAAALERIDKLDTRLQQFSENFAEITDRFHPDGTLREAVADEAKERVLVAVEKILLPTNLLLEEISRAGQYTSTLVKEARRRLRWTIFLVASILVVIAAWMTLGQLALLRNGLRRVAKAP